MCALFLLPVLQDLTMMMADMGTIHSVTDCPEQGVGLEIPLIGCFFSYHEELDCVSVKQHHSSLVEFG